MPDDVNVTPDSVSMSFSLVTPRVVLRTYLSAQHLWAANHFAVLALARETEVAKSQGFDIEHRALALAAVQSSVCFLEATINEIYQDAADGHMSFIEPLGTSANRMLAEVWVSNERVGRSLGTLDRYQFCLAAADRERLDPGQEPYQAAQLLIQLRNAVVHFRPQNYSAGEIDTLGAKLKGKFGANPLTAGNENVPFPDQVLGSPCAQWAVASSLALTDLVMKRLGIEAHYQAMTSVGLL